MKDMLVQLAGAGAVGVAITHGILLETKVFRRVQISPDRARLLIHGVCQISTVAWLSGGVLLMAIPYIAAGAARPWIIGATCVSYLFGAVGNAIASRGRHFGWMLMTAVIALAVAGV